MKNLFIFTILLYQKIFSPMFKNLLGVKSLCRFSPSCSEYAKQSIVKYGVLKGISMLGVRLVKCQPFSKFEYQNPKSEMVRHAHHPERSRGTNLNDRN